MKHNKSIWMLMLIAGVLCEIFAVLMITKVIQLPKTEFIEKNPLFIAGILLACGIMLIVKGYRMKKEINND